MALASHLKLNPTLADEGRWVTYRGARFRVRHWNYGPFQERLAEIQLELSTDDRNLEENGNLKAEHQAWAIREAMAEELIAEWADFDLAEGEPWEPTDEARKQFVHEPGYRHIVDALYSASRADMQFSEAAAAKAAGNSSSS